MDKFNVFANVYTKHTYGLYTANDLFEIKNILVYLNSNKTLKVLDYHLPKY